jgi:citrate lyase subunit beta/citryl-CoA lyase
MASLQTARSFLFAPGSDERKLVRALESDADAVVADLEDAVAAAGKGAARDLTIRLVADVETRAVRLVRVNGVETLWHDDDVTAVAASAADGLVLPKATAAAVAAVGERLDLPIVAIVETAVGLREALAIASHPSVRGLMLGAMDLGLQLGLEPRVDGQEILYARSSVVVDSAAAGLRGPVDRVWVDVRDLEGLAQDCALGRSLGFRGKALVHPDQIAPTHEAFAPSADELRRAREIVAAYERAEADGQGVVALDGEMIDAPVVERARELLGDKKRSVLHAE